MIWTERPQAAHLGERVMRRSFAAVALVLGLAANSDAATLDITYAITSGNFVFGGVAPLQNITTGTTTIRFPNAITKYSAPAQTGTILTLKLYGTQNTLSLTVPIMETGVFVVSNQDRQTQFGAFGLTGFFNLGSVSLSSATVVAYGPAFAPRTTVLVNFNALTLPTKTKIFRIYGTTGIEIARVIPEPGTATLLMIGLLGLGSFGGYSGWRRRPKA